MNREIHSLYVCYFGITEPLVQNQVVPYLRELARGGVRVSLLTFEPEWKTRWTPPMIAHHKQRLQLDGIDWHALPYHKRPSLPATIWDIVAGAWAAARIARRQGIQILHGRSHVGAAIAVLAKPLTAARVIFDIRGLLPEEYVDSGRWKAGGFLFRLVKAAERWLYRFSDGFVVLTSTARERLFPGGLPGGRPVELIPCCVDVRRFAGLRASDRAALRAELGVSNRLVFVHAGRVGGAYLTRETARFLAAARTVDARVFALVLTAGAPGALVEELEAAGFSREDYRVVQASPEEVPRYLNASDVGLVLARPSLATGAASPTRFAEYLAAGLPVLATAGVADLGTDLTEYRVGASLRTFDHEACVAAFRELEELRRDPRLGGRCRDLIRAKYDLRDIGGMRYRRLYDALLAPRPPRRLRVLALASYPVEAASSRFRIGQFIGPLAERGIDVDFDAFLDPGLFQVLYEPRRLLRQLPHVGLRVLRRLRVLARASRADVVFVQREAMLFGPPLIEWVAARLLRRPLVLDLDDPTYLPYTSPVYGRLATVLKWPGKTGSLIRWAGVVTCGNPTIAAHVRSRGGEAHIIPNVVDKSRFRPAAARNGIPVIGWIGTHGTYPFLERLLPVFQRLARNVPFRLLIVGSGQREIQIPGVEVAVRAWDIGQEADDFRSLDIGVYPMPDDEWSASKSGLKAVLYMMSGVAAVISPVGVCKTLGTVGDTHLTAVTDDEWLHALQQLATDADLRARIRHAARGFAERNYRIEPQADHLATIIRAAVRP